MGIVDGYEGKIIIDPPVSVMEAYQKKKAEDEEKKRLLQELKGRSASGTVWQKRLRSLLLC